MFFLIYFYQFSSFNNSFILGSELPDASLEFLYILEYSLNNSLRFIRNF